MVGENKGFEGRVNGFICNEFTVYGEGMAARMVWEIAAVWAMEFLRVLKKNEVRGENFLLRKCVKMMWKNRTKSEWY